MQSTRKLCNHSKNMSYIYQAWRQCWYLWNQNMKQITGMNLISICWYCVPLLWFARAKQTGETFTVLVHLCGLVVLLPGLWKDRPWKQWTNRFWQLEKLLLYTLGFNSVKKKIIISFDAQIWLGIKKYLIFFFPLAKKNSLFFINTLLI